MRLETEESTFPLRTDGIIEPFLNSWGENFIG